MFCLKYKKDESRKITGYFESKNSKFICYLLPWDLTCFKKFKQDELQKLKKEHKKATHFVTSYRILNNFLEEGFNDDFEPHGSAGKPILEILRNENIINILCICVRYFGGVKLGIGNLSRAYKLSLLNAITKLKNKNLIQEFKILSEITLNEHISNSDTIIFLLLKHNININKKKFKNDRVEFILSGHESNLSLFLNDYKGK